MKSFLKRALRRIIRLGTSRLEALVRNSVSVSLESSGMNFESLCQQTQRCMLNQYAFFREHKIVPYQNIRAAGFRAYSQFEEDGIILYVLAMIGFKSRRVVEMCCGSGIECMATNLILNHGFEGLLFDGDNGNVERANAFFRAKKDCLLQSPTVNRAWVTAENVNSLLTDNNCGGEIDLLSLDVDGNEYWIWKAINTIQPRLVVVETHNIISEDKRLTVPYRPDFDYHKSSSEDFRSASLLAMVNIGRERGYRLIGAHRHGFNAFFLRNDEGQDTFPEVSIKSVHDNAYTRWSQATRWPPVKSLPWLEV
jgi:methyltransferase FkbM-like protein